MYLVPLGLQQYLLALFDAGYLSINIFAPSYVATFGCINLPHFAFAGSPIPAVISKLYNY